ncbi:hypothetical protein [Mucilaginibacter auburnensis]|uniref:Uncharacterized protein n=1 Tax=Mucilaginibacter auburnensis TaxID=1457233 RepID=A0A2H9VPK3_9SPHI|nr:hypothetical protein [Mucilaginibacter auburnensis]PJJ80242.1 hypothetical protein CLV57_3389 [Mucilaginibacter auburnensis]
MTTTPDTIPAERDGKYKFTISYAEREVSCQVEKEQNILHVIIDENLKADLKINADGSLVQVEGSPIPDSCINYIKKQVLGHS